MKNLVNLLIGVAAISTILAIISRLTSKAVLGLGPLAMAGFAITLLLLAIALSVKK